MSNERPAATPLLTSLTHRAMATEFCVMLPQSEIERCDPVIEALESLDEIEAALTIYRESSEVSKINQLAGQQSVRVTESTFRLLMRAKHWSERTSGAFDITAGPLVQVWGFTERSGRKPHDDEIQAARGRVGFEHLDLDENHQTVRFLVPGMSINLGAIGKGDALDRLSLRLSTEGIENFLIHGGSSSVLAIGDQSPGSEQGWAVGIAHPTKPRRRIGGIWLRDGALATSGSGKQFFHHQGRRYGHVIDPRTGYPAGDLLSLTVLTQSAADADAAATGYFVAGSQQLQQVCEEDDSLAMIAAKAGKRQDEVEITPFGSIQWVNPDREF